MLRLGLRSGSSSQPQAIRGSAQRHVSLGALEAEVMAVLWSAPPREISVRDLLPRLAPRAYTTVMTTLDRLFKKGLLLRRKADRAFLYRPRCSRQEWESEQAGALIEDLLAAGGAAHGLVLASLVEAVGPGQEALLAELEAKIRAQRESLRGAAGAGLDRPPRRPR
ncbi:MAG: BlaI/MecI/CopY family transcriptional regulator [Terriglobales bacterium]